MNRLFQFLLLTVMVSSAFAAGDEAPSNTEWKNKMNQLSLTITSLLSQASSPERFRDPKNKASIQKNIDSLKTLAHTLNPKKMSSSKKDPTLAVFAKDLEEKADNALQAFSSGHMDYSRRVVRQVTASCIACHSRNASGPQFGDIGAPDSSMNLKPIELARYFAATRQFDRAFDESMKLVKDQSTTSPWEWQEAVDQALNLAVRVKRDPKAALGVTEAILHDDHTPKYLKQNAKTWEQSIASWKKELKAAALKSSTLSEGALLKEAQRLFQKGQKLQKFPMDFSGNVFYLRSTSVLHDLLQNYPEGKKTTEALFWIAQGYENLSALRDDDIQNVFYEACIHEKPHSDLALKCYHRYEQNTIFGFTGSSGTHLPDEIQEKLLHLGAEAAPRKQVR